MSNSCVPNPQTVANTLVDTGIGDNIESILPLLQEPNSFDILYIADRLATGQKSTHTIVAATERSAKVVFGLKIYFHYNFTGEKSIANLTQGIETILNIYRSQPKRGVEVVRNYEAKLPQLVRYADEINQVRTNLIRNPIGATDNCGVLTVEVR